MILQVPIGSIVVPFCGSYLGCYKVIPKRSYVEPVGKPTLSQKAGKPHFHLKPQAVPKDSRHPTGGLGGLGWGGSHETACAHVQHVRHVHGDHVIHVSAFAHVQHAMFGHVMRLHVLTFSMCNMLNIM